MEKKMIGDMSDYAGMLKDLFRQIQDGSITREMLALFLQHENSFDPIYLIIQEWQIFYREYFGIDVNFSDVDIPGDLDNLNNIIFIPPKLAVQQVLKVIGKHFKVDNYFADSSRDIRDSDHSYAVSVMEQLEVNSPDDLEDILSALSDKKSTSVMVLLECLVIELKRFSKTGQHLCSRKWILCNAHADIGVIYDPIHKLLGINCIPKDDIRESNYYICRVATA